MEDFNKRELNEDLTMIKKGDRVIIRKLYAGKDSTNNLNVLHAQAKLTPCTVTIERIGINGTFVDKVHYFRWHCSYIKEVAL